MTTEPERSVWLDQIPPDPQRCIACNTIVEDLGAMVQWCPADEVAITPLCRGCFDLCDASQGLDVLAWKHGTDKSSRWHNYTRLYEPLFTRLRGSAITLVELGVAWGGSIRMWREYFIHPNTKIIGVDLFQECPPPDLTNLAGVDDWQGFTGVQLIQMDQADPRVGGMLNNIHPHIVIDDCSHIPEKTWASFELFWPHLITGGVYAIEDLGIHDYPYDELIDKIRATPQASVELHASQHPHVNWEIAIITKLAHQW